MATTTLYLVRHAHADWQPDESRPLSESGRAAARVIAGLLSTTPVAAIYSSPAQRSIETVEPLAQRLGIRVDVVPELRERQLPAVPAADFERIVEEAWRVPTRATADGESNAVAQTRGLTAIRQFIARHAEQPLVVATHGNLMALILNGFDPSFGYEFWRELSFPDVYELEFELAILLAVSSGPRYGLAVIQYLETFTDLVVTEGTIYPILGRLTREGLLAAEWVEGEAPHARKYYRLTRMGVRRLSEMKAEWRTLAEKIGRLMTAAEQEGL